MQVFSVVIWSVVTYKYVLLNYILFPEASVSLLYLLLLYNPRAASNRCSVGMTACVKQERIVSQWLVLLLLTSAAASIFNAGMFI